MAVERALGGSGGFPFLDLPPKTQRGIFSHCAQNDLICLALVSRHFHELASALLYRNFHIIFPDNNHLDLNSPIAGLAGGLDTFTTSEYNYSKHLRNLSADTLSAGGAGEKSYRSYLHSTSCGKFLNSLLYLTLKEAKSLEAFRWNIRVELSRPVYRVLHQIPSLRKLHLRLQAGESYYVPPPPLPVSANAAGQSSPPPEPITATSSTPLSFTVSSIVTAGPPPGLAPPSKRFSFSRPREPSTLSGFNNLQALSVLDIDHLDIVSELRMCMKQSSSTLTELQLSLSDSLAMHARKPPQPDSEDDDSDVDEESQMAPASQNTGFDATGPAKAFRAQEERKIQEAVLGRIFDVEPLLVKKPPIGQKSNEVRASEGKSEQHGDGAGEGIKDAHEEFVFSIEGGSPKSMCLLNGSCDFRISQEDILDTGEKADRNYVVSNDLPPSEGQAQASSGSVEAGSSTNGGGRTDSQTDTAQNGTTDGDENGASQKPNSEGAVAEAGDNEDVPSLPEGRPLDNSSVSRPGASGQGLQPGDIDSATLDPVGGILDDAENAAEEESLPPQIPGADSKEPPKETPSSNADQIRACHSDIESAESKCLHERRDGRTNETDRRHMDECVRDTRRFALESLSIHLIPVEPSVLSCAVDLSCLKKLTLLNVGNQEPIWTCLEQENKAHPLALRSVFTDNVSNPFLTCMSQLEDLTELFLLERGAKHKPGSFAPRSSTTMDQIRQFVLKKHMTTLKRLMIKDESNDPSWEANEKTMFLICSSGIHLEELAVSMGKQATHVFLQNLRGLTSLQAINILYVSYGTYTPTMYQLPDLITNNLSYNPELKLEWIAVGNDRVYQVVRPLGETATTANGSPSGSRGNIKGKQPTSPSGSPDPGDEAFPDSDSESEDSLRFRLTGRLHFNDVRNVKIFKKEIRSGRI